MGSEHLNEELLEVEWTDGAPAGTPTLKGLKQIHSI